MTDVVSILFLMSMSLEEGSTLASGVPTVAHTAARAGTSRRGDTPKNVLSGWLVHGENHLRDYNDRHH